jgi:hypothetical protein
MSPTAPRPAVDEGVLRLADIDGAAVRALLSRHDLELRLVADGADIPGSYWGESEAGLIGTSVHARADTPVHSLLHEAAHLIVMPAERRARVHTDATDSIAEEDAACYLQILLADALPDVGRARLMADMDAWGYSFRLGSTRAWFERDAEDARAYLIEHGLIEHGLIGHGLVEHGPVGHGPIADALPGPPAAAAQPDTRDAPERIRGALNARVAWTPPAH